MFTKSKTKQYSIGIAASNDTGIKIKAIVVNAESKQIAEQKSLEYALGLWPLNQGWENHTATILSED